MSCLLHLGTFSWISFTCWHRNFKLQHVNSRSVLRISFSSSSSVLFICKDQVTAIVSSFFFICFQVVIKIRVLKTEDYFIRMSDVSLQFVIGLYRLAASSCLRYSLYPSNDCTGKPSASWKNKCQVLSISLVLWYLIVTSKCWEHLNEFNYFQVGYFTVKLYL